MTQEQINLLLKDISARLPYGVKASTKLGNNIKVSFIGEDTIIGEDGDSYDISFITPYLFPLSSMTEEQKEEYTHIVNYISSDDTDNWKEGEFIYVEQLEQLLYFYHKNYLDYRDLISMGLAIDCTNLNIY